MVAFKCVMRAMFPMCPYVDMCTILFIVFNTITGFVVGGLHTYGFSFTVSEFT